jgi:hypothetical protein
MKFFSKPILLFKKKEKMDFGGEVKYRIWKICFKNWCTKFKNTVQLYQNTTQPTAFKISFGISFGRVKEKSLPKKN